MQQMPKHSQTSAPNVPYDEKEDTYKIMKKL